MKLDGLNPHATQIMVNRYALRDANNMPVESPSEIFLRTARVVAEAENNYRNGSNAMEVREKFFQLMYEMRFVPNGRTMANAGTKYGQLANCFVLPVEDDLGKGTDSIFSVLRKAILTLQTGGGVGFTFGHIRPKGGKIGSGKGKATGAVSFIKVYDTAFWVIGQGGGRRSAAMAVLPVWHPDIYEFIRCKAEEGTIENFNISVGVTDEFMAAVKNDDDFALRHPENGELWKMVPARELFGEVVKYAHRNGEPGVLFLDAAERGNPVSHLYKLEATNPCFAGDTRIPTKFGMLKIEELARVNLPIELAVDVRTENSNGIGTRSVLASNAFLSGKKRIYRITTSKGFTLKVTRNHRLFTKEGEYAALADLKVGDELAIQSGDGVWSKIYDLPNKSLFNFQHHAQHVGSSVATRLAGRYRNVPDTWSRELGVLIGWLVGDGWITKKSNSPLGFAFGKNESGLEGLELISSLMKKWFTGGHLAERPRTYQLTFGKTPTEFFETLGVKDVPAYEKSVPEAIYGAPREVVTGFLQGLFSADGTVQVSPGKQYSSVRLSSSSKRLLGEVQLLLLNLGIVGAIKLRRKSGKKLLPDAKGNKALYNVREQYELIIGKESRNVFHERVGFVVSSKREKLTEAMKRMERGSYKENYVDKIVKIEPLGVEKVYDITEPSTHSLIGNGFVTHNCGEQFLGPYENCCLGSINLRTHVRKIRKSGAKDKSEKSREEYVVDWEKLAESVRIAVRFLDNVVDVNKYVAAVPELEEAAKKVRRIGVSVMGLSDLMYLVGVRYGSKEGQEFASQIMEWVRYHSMLASIELARYRGPFPGIAGSIYDPTNVTWQVPKPKVRHTTNWKRSKVEWKKVLEGLKKHGIRNGAQTTVAPTGSIATISGLEGYGCEPVFALSYVRNTREGAEKEGKEWREMYYTSTLFEQALKREGKTAAERKKILEEVRARGGSVQGLKSVSKKMQETYVVAGDLTVEEHVRMQAVMQTWVDNSISKTINFPPEATADEVAKAYQLGWELGLKGMTVYVEGSREQVVLSKKKPFEPNGEDKEKCPECGGALRIEEGCATCPSCGYSRCDK